MEYRRCQPPCARFIASDDPHSKCVKCLGFSHARESVYGISKCKFCENLRLRTLRSRLEVFEKESSVPPRPIVSPRPGVRMLSSRLWRVSRQASPFLSLPLPSTYTWFSPAKFAHEYLYPSLGARDTVAFGLDDILLKAASDSEDFGPALADALPPNGQEARKAAVYSGLRGRAFAHHWEALSGLARRASKPDKRFLSGPNSRPERRKLPFFSDLHQEISRSWKQPFSSRLTWQLLTSPTLWVLWSRVTLPYLWLRDTLASHLSPSLAPSWKSRPLLPTKPCRTPSALIGKSYIAAGQAGMALHTKAILQAYQADVLKEMDEGTGLTPEAVKELRRATDMALRATMAGSVAAECHLWLNLTEICENEKVFLLDAPISQSGLFGEVVSSVLGSEWTPRRVCFWGSLGFHSDAGPFGSCPDFQFYSMSGPLQARPSCLCRYLPQAARPYGSGLSCVAPRVASHEAVPLVDERAEVTPHYTSHSPYQGVAQLLSTPFKMAGPRFSPERGQNGCDPPSPYDHDGHINDRLGRGLRRQTGERGMDRRVPFLAHKLPGTQGCLPGFDVFSPRSQGASYHSQNGQYGGSVPHKPSGRFTVAHPGQACSPSSPLVPGQVPFFEGSSRSRSTRGRMSVCMRFHQ